MSFSFRAPSLSAQTTEGQLHQLVSFLRQHVQQLNWVLKNLETQDSTALTGEQLTQALSQSPEFFQTVYRKLKKKQAQDNFLGAAGYTVLENGAWSQGDTAAADMEAVGRYTLYVAVTGGLPVVCARQGTVLHGQGLTLTCGDTGLTVTEAESPVTALYAVV